ncbi:MAG: M23 family metallopeptidase [Candidatus Eremiobacterota bacterium]
MRLALLLVALLSAVAVAEPSTSLMGNPRQGDPLFLKVRDVAPGTTGTVRWANQRFELAPAGESGEMRTVIPVPVDLTPARHRVVVELSAGTSLERSVTVQKRGFGFQSVSLDPATLASYDDPQNKADDRAILDALTPFDPEQHWRGNFILPVDAPQTTAFGVKRLYNGWKKGWHKGLDLAGWEGQEVVAPAAGVVLHTARGVVNGNTVVLGHGLGIGSVYLHLNSIEVAEGEKVEQGQVIGTVGGTGGFAPHLHWEVRLHGVPVEPRSLFALPAAWR